ncbi:YdgH/BhsA/McbA-like domain containing protein [Pseudomonas graminis]
MKQFIAVAALLFVGVQAFNASAAQEITREQAQEMKLEKIGTVTTNSTTSPMDADARLSEKADAKGGKYYVIIAAQEGNHDHALADVYR